MEKFEVPIQIRWADIDANAHLRHSAYYDYGASMRMTALHKLGITLEKLKDECLGPILFREEALFRKEIKLEDHITIDIQLVKLKPNGQRWSLRHHIRKSDGTVAAIINIDGAWMDIRKRKLAEPNEYMKSIWNDCPRSDDFSEL
ncbi:MAG: thioesterase [Flammeovirgaceae bacterium]|nr:thioesterase [Flammeovirgaceae bacterium]